MGVPSPFWFDFSQNPDAKLYNVLEELADYLKVPEIAIFDKEKEEVGKVNIKRLTDELNRNILWLVFDDLSTILEDRNFNDKGLEALFFALHNNTHKAKILITSRTIPMFKNGGSLIDPIKGEKKQKLDGLKTEFAIEFLVNNGFKRTDLDQLTELVESVEGHPLALELLVGLRDKYKLSDILSDLELYQDKKDKVIRNTRRLFDKLAGNEKELLERISVYREPVGLQGIKEMYTKDTPKNAIETLIEKSLLETDHAGKYFLHPLIQEFSYKDLENKEEVHLCAAKYYKSLLPHEKPSTKDHARLLIEAHYHFCKAEEYDEAVTIASIIFDSNLDERLNVWGYSKNLIEIYELILHKDHLKDNFHFGKQTYGALLSNLGNAYRNLGDPNKAIEYYESALKIAKENNDEKAEGNNLGYLGNAYRNIGKLEESTKYYENAIQILRKVGDIRGEGINYGNLGIAYSDGGKTEEAIECYQKALEISRKCDEKGEEGNYLGNLGSAYRNLGELDKSIEYYINAIKILNQVGDRRRKGNHIGNLGSSYRDLGNQEKAIKCYKSAIKILRSVGDKRREGNHLGNLGSVYLDLKEPKTTIQYCEKGQKILKDVGDKRGEGNILNILGSAYRDLDFPRKAIEFYVKALKIQEEVKNKRGIGNNLRDLGFVYLTLGESGKGIEYLTKALDIGKEIKDPRISYPCDQKIKSLQESK